jgi:hypothetical protein
MNVHLQRPFGLGSIIMATKKPDPAPGAEAPEPAPQAGGSYTRNADGSLTKTEGPDLAPAPSDATTTQQE